jgi:hypothetical protein
MPIPALQVIISGFWHLWCGTESACHGTRFREERESQICSPRLALQK